VVAFLPDGADVAYRSAYYELRVDADRRVAVLYRTDVAFPSIAAMRAEHARLVAAFGPELRALGIVVDLRAARPNNDDAFEAALQTFRVALSRSFARVVTVVQSASGAMQLARLHRQDGTSARVTHDVELAYDLARGKGG
jgi:Ni,Fe-hydrogenase III large subunit